MAIGPNSRWRCNPGCQCSVAKRHGQQRCKEKVAFIQNTERIPDKIYNILYKLDLGIDEGQVRYVGYWRNLIKDWLWKQ